MKIKFLIDKEQRKEVAQAVAEFSGLELHYLGAPTFTYQIGFFTLTQDCVLEFEENHDSEIVQTLFESLHELGYEWENLNEKLTISMPKDFFDETTLENLKQLIENKENLLKHAFETDSLEITETDETIEFPWFTLSSPEDSSAYQQFILMLCEFAKNQKRVNNKPDTSDNEKYAFRCFLLRIGMIGADFKQTRKILLRNLSGSSAFRHGKPKKEDSNDEISD